MNEEQAKTVQQQWAKIIAKAWADEDFKARLIADPAETLKAEGIEVPDGMIFKVVENTENLAHIIIPFAADTSNIEDLKVRMAAGSCVSRSTCV